MKKNGRISTENKEEPLKINPFDQLDFSKIQLAQNKTSDKKVQTELPSKEPGTDVLKKQKVYIRQEKAGRGGKTVTVLMGLENAEERKMLLKAIQKLSGSGGTIKGEVIEIQGEKRDEVASILKEKRYNVVFSGG